MSRYRVDGSFCQPVGRLGPMLLRKLREEFQGSRTGYDLPGRQRIRPGPRPPRLRCSGASNSCWNSGACGTPRFARSTPGFVRRPVPGRRRLYAFNLTCGEVGELAPISWPIAQRSTRRHFTVGQNGKNGKEYRATMGRKPIVGLFSVGLEEPYRWKDSVQSDAEIRIWTLDGIANGMRPWFSKFSGVLHDPRWLEVVEDIFTWHKKAEHYLRHETPLARVALVYSQQTAWFYGGSRV